MKSSQPEITHDNYKIYLRFIAPEFDKVGITDYNENLWLIITSKKWRTNKSYILSGKISLHRFVMEYWYGATYCKQKIKSGAVIDHIDNNGFNCTYENLEFLDRIKNWAYKGQYYDRKRSKTTSIGAVNIFKNKSDDKYQITIGFNIPFYDSSGQAISKAFLAYNTSDYDLVLADAVQLVESLEKGQIRINSLRCSRLRWDYQSFIVSETSFKPGNVIKINGEWYMIQGEGVRIEKAAPDKTL